MTWSRKSASRASSDSVVDSEARQLLAIVSRASTTGNVNKIKNILQDHKNDSNSGKRKGTVELCSIGLATNGNNSNFGERKDTDT